MKLKHIFGLCAAVVMFASCDSTDLADMPAYPDGHALRINSVSQNDFVSGGGSRSTCSDTYATVFEEGDRLGLILIDNDGKQVANVPFTYTAEGTWNNDRNQLYLSDVAKIVAYAPYDENLPSGVCDADALKNTVNINVDQSDINAFKAADLLVCELANPKDELDIRFSHAFSMMRFSSRGSVNAGNREYEYSIALDGLKVSIGNDVYTPCPLNGSYVMIVKDGTRLQPEAFKYTYIRYGEDRATKTIVSATGTDAGTIYSFPCPSVGGGTPGLMAGSFYCVTEGEGETVMIPAGAASVPSGLTCLGIVFHTMDDSAFAAFVADNGLDAAEYAGIGGRHGLLVGLEPGGLLFGNYSPEDASHAAFIENIFAGLEDSGNTDKALGYKLTRAIVSTCQSNEVLTFSALEDAPARLPLCTPWYVPSFHELKYLIRGEENADVVCVSGQEALNTCLTAAAGVCLEGNMPSVSYKSGTGFCIMEGGNEMGWHGVPTGEKCRLICAF